MPKDPVDSVAINTRLSSAHQARLHVLKKINPKHTVRYLLEATIDHLYNKALAAKTLPDQQKVTGDRLQAIRHKQEELATPQGPGCSRCGGRCSSFCDADGQRNQNSERWRDS